MNFSQGELVALAYGAVLVTLLVYVAIIAAKISRLDRESSELADLARGRDGAAAEDAEEKLATGSPSA